MSLKKKHGGLQCGPNLFVFAKKLPRPRLASIHVRAAVVVSELMTFELKMFAESASLVSPLTPR